MIRNLIIIIVLIFPKVSYSSEAEGFDKWLLGFKKKALNEGISHETIKNSFKNVRYLKQVIKYDRRQPEFFEDTITYVGKRATIERAIRAKKLLDKNNSLFNEIEKIYQVEKELLLSLWAIETNFGTYVGKMDIISSLATLSFDKRRSEFFSKQLLVLLKLIDKKLINVDTLYGSWAGAFGNFQFMPTTIQNYAIDYDKNNKIELKKSLYDSLASAANYLNKIGWKINRPCFIKVNSTKKIKDELINTSARNIKNRLSLKKWSKLGIESEQKSFNNNKLRAALILPDSKPNSPMYLVFSNYEVILQWNRSLRFGISVCTLIDLVKDEK